MEQPNSKQPDIKPTEQQQHASSAFPEITKPINERPGREPVYLTDCDIK